MTNKLSLNDAIKIAESREGKCLSKEYINCETPMLWECNKNHQWTAQFCSIKNCHSWCPHCANKKLSIAVAKELAHAKNGKCISENYIIVLKVFTKMLRDCGMLVKKLTTAFYLLM